MRIKAALYNADHLEYGLVTIPFPIPQDQYNDTIKMLEALDIGDPRAKDCMVEEIEGCVPSLKCLEGHRINVDELDYLVKRLDSFSDGELAQFQGMAAKMGLSDMTDLINLTFCCQQATVITDFSDLEQIGRDHYMNLHGGCVSMEELEELDGMETALLLISENEGTVTPYGVVYDNGMQLSRIYQGRNFPEYLYEESLMTVSLRSIHESDDSREAVWLYLPTSERQIERMLDVFIEENDLRKVVFHSLRHSSTSIKLQISCGNIKAVQADTGHAQARMVTEVYAHTNNEERQLLAQKVDEKFFQKPLLEAAPPASEMQKVLQILAEKPELMKLLAAM